VEEVHIARTVAGLFLFLQSSCLYDYLDQRFADSSADTSENTNTPSVPFSRRESRKTSR
jgi:hypothetical protein